MSVEVEECTDDQDSSSKDDVTMVTSSAMIVPLSIHDASIQALLTNAPQLSPTLNTTSNRTVASSTCSSQCQDSSPTSARHPFCIDRSILVKGNQYRYHKRNKSAPIWLHNPAQICDNVIKRRNSFDELYEFKVDVSVLPLKFTSTASTDEGVGLCYESGSVSTPSSEDKIDEHSIDSALNSCDTDETSNADSTQEYAGFPGLINSATWIAVQGEQGASNLVSVKVGSKSSHVVHFAVKQGDVITWEFATTKRDIGFGILFECSVVEDKKTEDGEISDIDSITYGYGVIPILPIFKVKSNISPIFGSHEAITDGVYVMTWDNSYSRFFAKDLYYRIGTQTEIRSSEYPHGIISFQHALGTLGYPLVEEAEETSTDKIYDDSSNNSEVNENTICETTESHNVVVISQNDSNETPTVYFDVAQQGSVQEL